MIWTLRILTFDEETHKRFQWLVATLRQDPHVASLIRDDVAIITDHRGLNIVTRRHVITVTFRQGFTCPRNPTLQHLDRIYAEFRPAGEVEPAVPSDIKRDPKRLKTRWDYLMEDDD